MQTFLIFVSFLALATSAPTIDPYDGLNSMRGFSKLECSGIDPGLERRIDAFVEKTFGVSNGHVSCWESEEETQPDMFTFVNENGIVYFGRIDNIPKTKKLGLPPGIILTTKPAPRVNQPIEKSTTAEPPQGLPQGTIKPTRSAEKERT
ncbi:Hypothetical predicted protein [Cloeon dipterum]|uniref:Uncharacterized protein n=1 Tax=Cloeon dipterum TaxID=197152 RepID=A0A8S1DTC6_9INSE|nr:Hypothetical predicted protein [Cloeon dipterum]